MFIKVRIVVGHCNTVAESISGLCNGGFISADS
jgi:hypothetical protein